MSLARNALYNFAGALLPALLNVLTIPYIVHALGPDDFGLLTLVSAIVGYFALVDINVTAGSTKYVSEHRAAGNRAALQETLSFGAAFYVALGLLGLALLSLGAPWLVERVFAIAPARHGLATEALRVAAIGFAITQLQSYLQSIPGALMRFDVSGRIEAVFGTAIPLLSVAWLASGGGLLGLIWMRVVGSLLQSMILLLCIDRLVGGLRLARPSAQTRKAMLGFSGWAFLSRVAGITYAQADKMIVGAKIGTAGLTYFAVPSTLVTRVMAVIYRFSGVMFPHASALGATGRFDELVEKYIKALRYTSFCNGAIAATLIVLAHPILRFWIGPEMADRASLVLSLAAATLLIDSLTNLPSLITDGLGRPAVTGTVAASRVSLGLLFVFVGVSHAGIIGAAMGQLASAVIGGSLFLWYAHGRTVPVSFARVASEALLPTGGALAPGVLCLVLLKDLASVSLVYFMLVVGLSGIVFAVSALGVIVSSADRTRFLAAMLSIFKGSSKA